MDSKNSKSFSSSSKGKPKRVFLKPPPKFVRYSALEKLDLFVVFTKFLAYHRLADDTLEEQINRTIKEELALPNSTITSPRMRRFLTIDR